MKYTMHNLVCRFVKVGTPECEEFLNACDDLGLTWKKGDEISSYRPDKGSIAVSGSGRLGCNKYENYYLECSYSPFEPKTDTTLRTAESSSVKTRKCHSLMCENMVDGNVGTYCGCNHTAVDEIDNTVTQRGERYGLFADGAVIMQDLKTVMRATPGWERLTPSQREALEMIQHKIGRVLNGDPMYVENFTDIAGYAILVKDEMLRTDGATDAKITYVERVDGSWIEVSKRTS